ncbi:hypothetical protein EON80_01655 [bacterium]|nr:MAG: hypothetical protein EON80_01655 [bacterium]
MIDPYSVLGVAGDAEFETIRAAYRRLVRENHPDVAPDKGSATIRMAQINEAWQLLGAPEKRANFDALSRLQAVEHAAQIAAEERARLEAQRRSRREHEKSARTGKSQSRSKSSSSSQTRTATSQSRSSGKSTSTRTRKTDPFKRSARAKNPAREMRLLRKVAHASQLFRREGKADEAAALCREILLADGRNVQARELMGDILAHQGRLESALMMFDQAIQIAPQDRMLRRKRDQLQLHQTHHLSKPAPPQKTPKLSLFSRLRARLCKSSK